MELSAKTFCLHQLVFEFLGAGFGGLKLGSQSGLAVELSLTLGGESVAFRLQRSELSFEQNVGI